MTGKELDNSEIHIQPSVKICNHMAEHLDGFKAVVGQSLGLSGFWKRTFIFKRKVKKEECWGVGVVTLRKSAYSD